MALEQAGFPMEETPSWAERKDAGLTPAQLAWVLSQVSIDNEASVPGDVDPAQLQRYLEGLIKRLTRLAYPESPNPE
jgi:hypothetical protein